MFGQSRSALKIRIVTDWNRNTAALETKPPPIHLGQGFMKYDTVAHIFWEVGLTVVLNLLDF